MRTSQLLINIITNYSSQISSSQNTDHVSFHKRFHQTLKRLDSSDFIYYIIEQNLLDNDFLNYNWTAFDIPFLKIYNDSNIDLKYNLFFPNKLYESNTASFMIHSHTKSVLSSYMFYGPGYHTIHFDKNVIYKTNQYVDLKIKKDFFHSQGNINIVDSYEPHVLFNVSKPTFTIVLWSDSDKSYCNVDDYEYKELSTKNRSFYLDKGKIKSISDSEFVEKLSFKASSFINVDYHVQAICYFIQQVGYDDFVFLDIIVKSESLSSVWEKWITRLLNKDLIHYPYFNEELNFFSNQSKIDEIRSFCK